MEAIRELSPDVIHPSGYDGQFYVQIALCPDLRCPDLAPALDDPGYRARRIGLPALAWLAGLGRTDWVLQAYALSNMFFWLLLVGLLWRHTGFQRWRDLLLALVLLLGTGSLTSLARALSDLPATVISLAAILAGGRWVWPLLLLSGAGLIKETTVLSFGAVLPPFKKPAVSWFIRVTGILVVLLLPLALWLLYLNNLFPGKVGSGSRNFDFRGLTYFRAMNIAWVKLIEPGPLYAPNLVHFPSLLTLTVQAIYLLIRPRLQDPFWRLGAGFALLLFVLSFAVLEDPYAYCRVLLPLTFAFNLLVHRFEQGRGYTLWFIAGNAGLSLLALRYVGNITGWWDL